MMPDGTHLAVKDEYVQTGDDCVRLDCVTEVLAVGTGVGVNVGLDTVARAGHDADEDWQFYLPCTLYNRNDSDGDGVEDYLGSYAQDLRDDKNGVLAVLMRQPANGTTFSVARLSIPAFDTALTPDPRNKRYFVQETDIGSLGVAPRLDGNVSLRASYPFAEERSFSLDTSGTGWQAFVPVRSGRLFHVTYSSASKPAVTSPKRSGSCVSTNGGDSIRDGRRLSITRGGARVPPAPHAAVLQAMDKRRERARTRRLPRPLLPRDGRHGAHCLSSCFPATRRWWRGHSCSSATAGAFRCTATEPARSSTSSSGTVSWKRICSRHL
jgi:hypothetical protein